MNGNLTAEKINISFNELTYDETTAIRKGAKQLIGSELEDLITNKEVQGAYPGGFVFIARIYKNCRTEGVNQFGHYDKGNWKIDFEHNYLYLEWENGWINSITKAYQLDNSILFFDIITGKWRTTFRTIKEIV